MTFGMLGLVGYNVIAIYLGIGTSGIDTSSFNQMSVLIMLGINLGGYFMIIFIHCIRHCKLVFRLLSDTFSYWYYQGAYSQTMVAHAFCNVDDVSWGTKGSTGSHGGNSHEVDKVFFVSSWYYLIYIGYSIILYWLISVSTSISW